MFHIEIDTVINNITSIFYHVGIWHRGANASVKEIRLKLFYSIYYVLFLISLIAGAITSENKDEAIFLTEVALAAVAVSVKLFCLIWKQKEILEMLTRIGIYTVEDHEKFIIISEKIEKFIRFVRFLFFFIISGGYSAVLVPIFRSDNELFFKIAFPLDWKNNDIGFWIATAFLLTEITLSVMTISFSVIIWYLMINCALRYEMQGRLIRNLGVIRKLEVRDNKRKTSVQEKQTKFYRDLTLAIVSHQQTKELTNQVESFCSEIFFAQIATSGFSTCGSIYSLAYLGGQNLINYLLYVTTMVYNISDIFMITHFGNEIKLSSDQLSYSLFQSNWIDYPQSALCIIIFGELLKQPHELLVGKLYPLTLETFTRIINLAYNTFNILKNLN